MDSPPFMGSSASGCKKMKEELVRGHEFATQLQVVLHDQLTGTARESILMTEDLVTKILRSFGEALAILSNAESDPPSRNQRRKPLKRRNMQEASTRVTSVPIEDGYAWRKYGQKEIFNAKHLRCYYRCSRRLDQGCQAAKQVQKIEDEPPTFWTKYIDHHTCQVKNQQVSLGMDSTTEGGFLSSFKSNTTIQQEPPFFSSSFPSTKEEHKKPMTTPSIDQQEHKPPSSLECYTPPQQDLITQFLSSMNPISTLPSTSKQDCEDVASRGSSTSSSSSFAMDMEKMDSVCLNDAFYDGVWF